MPSPTKCLRILSVIAAIFSTSSSSLASAATSNATASSRSSDTLCSLAPTSYASAKSAHPKYKFALDELEKHGIATWYSDRETNGDYKATAQKLVAQCDESTRLSLVVYGLPNKDCEAGYSSNGSRVQTASDYETFIDTLTDVVGSRKVLYVLEPDAVGLLVNGGCAVEYGYKENLLVAIDKLTETNENALVYVDVGFWNLFDTGKSSKVADIVKELVKAGRGRVRGITLNTSNYRPTKEMTTACTNFQTAYNSTDLNCIIDTSRNFNDTSSEEWCNRRTGGIGHPPTGSTGISNIDYFVWIKPPGESDGECDTDHTSDAMVGPAAGEFFPDQFQLLWNNGYLHKVDNMAGINLPSSGGGGISTAVIVVIVVFIALAIAAAAFLVYRRRQNMKANNLQTSRAYFA